MNALTNWWNNGDLGEVDTTVSIERKSIIFICVAVVITAVIIITFNRYTKK